MSTDAFGRSQAEPTSATHVLPETTTQKLGPEVDGGFPNVLEWIGGAFGDAIQRAKYP